MFEKIEVAENRYEELTLKISEPDVISNQEEYKKLMKEISDLEEIVAKYKEYKKINKELLESRQMLQATSDKDFESLIQEEIKNLEQIEKNLAEQIKLLLIPKDPNDNKNVIVEIRGGAGGEEAALFAGVLFRMYTKYAERKRWKVEMLDSNATEIGGFKEVVFSIEGKGAYSRLKFESGVHRVQRVPETESSGRIHTSTVTVAVLPEVDDVEVDINPNDLQIDTYRASGAGGQHINKTDSAIRITHAPSGIVVTCQDQRSQHKNKDKAMKVLRSRLFDMYQTAQNSEIAQNRKSQVGTGDRSERIRTYNYPQGRVTEHRIGITLYKIEEFLEGDIDPILDALVTTEQAMKLAGNDEYGV
jgi:peptide chain release factor 1